MKKFLSVILCIAVIVGVVGVGVTLVNNNKPQETFVPDRIVTLDGESTMLTDKQLKSLESGADISFASEMYRLSKVGDENIYEHTDGENIFVTKYIGVNAADKTYRTWEKVNDDIVTKALMNSELSGYITSGGISEILKGYTSASTLTETLKKYVSDEQLTEILAEYEKGADLTETLKKYVTDEQLTAILADYVKKSDRKPVVNMYRTSQLNFKANTMYIVQCFDTTSNLADFTIIGGGKNGKTGRFAMIFVGDRVIDSLIVYQTGSIILSDLAGTSGQSTGIKPAASSSILRVYEIGGKVL